MSKTIRGSGGGGGSSQVASARSPVESPDSLRSRQIGRVIDLLCEGEIEGLVAGDKSIFLDGTPLQNEDDTYNFATFKRDLREGYQSQQPISGFTDTESEYSVGVAVTHSAPVVRSVTNYEVSAVRVTVGIPQLYASDASSGDVSGATVQIAIDVQIDGSGYQTLISDTITGKTKSKYQRSYRVFLTGSGPWDIRVRRITADSTTAYLANATTWDSYTEIVDVRLGYPLSAVVGLEFDSSQFSTIPARAYDVKLLKVEVPSNYDPITRTYTGVWDGTFVRAWTDNPAWCWRDLATNPRYGAGRYLSSDLVNKWVLYEIAQRCDELVPDGLTGYEPRYTCNLYLQSREEAFKVLSNMAAGFEGMLYWAGGQVQPVQDAPRDPVCEFTAANVLDGRFVYSGSGRSARHTVALVTYNDPEDRCQPKVEPVVDWDAVARYGYNESEVVAVGCTSRGQAHRFGLSLIFADCYANETVTFQTGLDASLRRPGDIIKVLDPARVGKPWGGRLRAATTAQLTLDREVELESGRTYTVSVVLPDGSLAERAIANSPGTTSTLVLGNPLPQPPQTLAVWIISSDLISPQFFQVVSVAEKTATTYEITGLSYRSDKWDWIEQGTKLEPIQISGLPTSDVLPAPSGLVLAEETYQIAPNALGSRVIASWEPVQHLLLRGYIVEWRRGSDNWTRLPEQREVSATLPVVRGSVMDVRVCAVAMGGAAGPWADVDALTVQGKTTAAEAVTGLGCAFGHDGLDVWWTPPAGWDVAYAQVRVGAFWDSVPVAWQGQGSRCPLSLVAPGSYHVMVSVADTSGNFSAVPAALDVVVQPPSVPVPATAQSGEMLTISCQDCRTSYPIAQYLFNGAPAGGPSYQCRINWTGARTFAVQAIDSVGNASPTAQATVTISSVPTPASLTASPLIQSFRLDFPAAPEGMVTEIWEAMTNSRSSASHIADVPGGRGYVRTGLAVVDTRYCWLRYRDQYGTPGGWFPTSATGGVLARTSTDPGDWLTVLNGQISEDQLV